MLFSIGWSVSLFILESIVSARGQYGAGDCFMPPFICMAIPRGELMWAYPEWKLVGSYHDMIYAYGHAMDVLNKIKDGGSTLSAGPNQPNVTTWKNWVQYNAAKNSVNSEKENEEILSNEIQEDTTEALVWIVIMSHHEYKLFFNSIEDSNFLDSIMLVIRRSNDQFQNESDNLDVRLSKERLESDSVEISNENFPDYASSFSKENVLKGVSREVNIKQIHQEGDDGLNNGMNTKAFSSWNIFELKSNTENEKRQVVRQKYIIEMPLVDSKKNYFNRQSQEFVNNELQLNKNDGENINLQDNNEQPNQYLPKYLFSFLKRGTKRLHSQDVNKKLGLRVEPSGQNERSSLLNFIPDQVESVDKHPSGFVELGDPTLETDDTNQEDSLGETFFKERTPMKHDEKTLPLLQAKNEKDPYFELNCERFLKALQVDEEKQKEIEENTKQQADCKRWHQERKYRLTASCFGIVWNWTDTKPRLVYRLLYSFPNNSTEKQAALSWGRDYERKAALDYAMANNLTVEPSGLIVDLKRGFLAASPDGLIGNDTLCEIKCPYFLRNEVPLGLVKSDNLYCCTYDFDKGEVRLKRDHYYYYQLQGQMGISGRKKGIFILWSPRGFISEKIDFDPELWSRMVTMLEKFYKKYLVPEYLYNYHRYGPQCEEDV